MPSAGTILVDAVPTGGIVTIKVPGLRPGDVIPGTAVISVSDVLEPDAGFSVDFTTQTVDLLNRGADTWPSGAELEVTWQGELLEERVNALEDNLGVTDGSDAAPDQVGAYLSVSNIAGVAMAANTPVAVCTMPLPPGVWEVWGACDFTVLSTGAETQAGAPIQPNQLGSSICTRSDSLPTEEDLIIGTGVMNLIYSPLAAGQRQVLTTGQCRSNSADPLDLYLVAQIGLGSVTVKGYVSARRVR